MLPFCTLLYHMQGVEWEVIEPCCTASPANRGHPCPNLLLLLLHLPTRHPNHHHPIHHLLRFFGEAIVLSRVKSLGFRGYTHEINLDRTWKWWSLQGISYSTAPFWSFILDLSRKCWAVVFFYFEEQKKGSCKHRSFFLPCPVATSGWWVTSQTCRNCNARSSIKSKHNTKLYLPTIQSSEWIEMDLLKTIFH